MRLSSRPPTMKRARLLRSMEFWAYQVDAVSGTGRQTRSEVASAVPITLASKTFQKSLMFCLERLPIQIWDSVQCSIPQGTPWRHP